MREKVRGKRLRYWLVGTLFVALALSFVLCIVAGIGLGPALNQAENVLKTESAQAALGIFWLLGHGLHGAAVVVLPFLLLASMERRDARNSQTLFETL